MNNIQIYITYLPNWRYIRDKCQQGKGYSIPQAIRVAVAQNCELSGTEDGWQAQTRLIVKLKEFVEINVYGNLQEVTYLT
jgi:hypothetical protein